MGTVWELDFYSRPILDERQKKRWEILVCEGVQDVKADPDHLFRYNKFLSSSEVNSIQLKGALEEAIAQAPNPPSQIRFFRYQMRNMIIRACEDLGIPAKASRRTLTLQLWLEQRKQEVYPQDPGYQSSPSPLINAAPISPSPLPDALLGQQWAFVSLEASAFADLPEWSIDFGESFPLDMAGVAPDARIPGVIIYSQRALPLAGWMSGLELSYLKAKLTAPVRLLLETGATESWILADITSSEIAAEAAKFEEAKQKANQVHFLAVQIDPQSKTFAGFWLLREVDLG